MQLAHDIVRGVFFFLILLFLLPFLLGCGFLELGVFSCFFLSFFSHEVFFPLSFFFNWAYPGCAQYHGRFGWLVCSVGSGCSSVRQVISFVFAGLLPFVPFGLDISSAGGSGGGGVYNI